MVMTPHTTHSPQGSVLATLCRGFRATLKTLGRWLFSGGRQFSVNTPDQRKQPRIQLPATMVHVTDGCLFATAQLENISPHGVCLRYLPEQLYSQTSRLTIFSSENPGIPVLQIEPRWEQIGWRGKTIGATILNVSETWKLFFIHSAGSPPF